MKKIFLVFWCITIHLFLSLGITKTATLTIGDKQGDYKDLEQRTFRIKLYLPVENKDKSVWQEVQVKYQNKQQIVKF